MKIGESNLQARRFLHELLLAIKSKTRKHTDKRIQDFVTDFFKVPYATDDGQNGIDENLNFVPEGGGLAITHTTIDLGE